MRNRKLLPRFQMRNPFGVMTQTLWRNPCLHKEPTGSQKLFLMGNDLSFLESHFVCFREFKVFFQHLQGFFNMPDHYPGMLVNLAPLVYWHLILKLKCVLLLKIVNKDTTMGTKTATSYLPYKVKD